MKESFIPDILYCDHQKVIKTLSILVTELVTDYSMKSTHARTRERGVKADADYPLGRIAARYCTGDSAIVEKEALVSRPPEALFVDLHTLLESEERILRLIGFDRAIWNQLELGEFLEVDGTIELSPLQRTIDTMFQLWKALPPEETKPTSTKMRGMKTAERLLQRDEVTLILAPLLEDSSMKFLASVKKNPDYLPEGAESLEGEFTLFGRVRKKFDEGEKVSLFNFLPGKMKLLSEKLLPMIESLNKLQDQGLDLGCRLDRTSLELEGPLIEINPIAIYQF